MAKRRRAGAAASRPAPCPYPLVEVEWDDARGLPGWSDPSTLRQWRHDFAARRIISLGYLVESDAATICIVSSYGLLADSTEPSVFGDALEVPRCMVKRLTKLRGGGAEQARRDE